MAGNANEMDLIHQLLTRNFIDMLQKGVQFYDKEGNVNHRPINAAELNTIRQFLKDNNISADSEFNGSLKELEDELPFFTENVVNFREKK
jgi:hypothetical protein